MNQRADSLKKNLQPIVAQPLIYHSGWLLSHTRAPQQGRIAEIESKRRVLESSRDFPGVLRHQIRSYSTWPSIGATAFSGTHGRACRTKRVRGRQIVPAKRADAKHWGACPAQA